MDTETLKTKQTGLSRDTNNNPVPVTFAKAALAVTRDTTISASTEITLNAKTSLVEVNAVGDNIYMRYGTSDASNTVFDEFIMAGTTRHFVVPSGVTALNFIDDGNAGTMVVIEK